MPSVVVAAVASNSTELGRRLLLHVAAEAGHARKHTETTPKPWLLWWQEAVLYALYALSSLLLTMDVDPLSMILPSSHYCLAAHKPATAHACGVSRRRKRTEALEAEDHYLQPSNSSKGHDVGACNNMGGTGNSHIVRMTSVVTHVVLLALIMQVPVPADKFMVPAKVRQMYPATCKL